VVFRLDGEEVVEEVEGVVVLASDGEGAGEVECGPVLFGHEVLVELACVASGVVVLAVFGEGPEEVLGDGERSWLVGSVLLGRLAGVVGGGLFGLVGGLVGLVVVGLRRVSGRAGELVPLLEEGEGLGVVSGGGEGSEGFVGQGAVACGVEELWFARGVEEEFECFLGLAGDAEGGECVGESCGVIGVEVVELSAEVDGVLEVVSGFGGASGEGEDVVVAWVGL